MITTRADPGIGSRTLKADAASARLWRQAVQALRRLWDAAIALPDRGDSATPDELPPEYFRFPRF